MVQPEKKLASGKCKTQCGVFLPRVSAWFSQLFAGHLAGMAFGHEGAGRTGGLDRTLALQAFALDDILQPVSRHDDGNVLGQAIAHSS
jgi:hypothetical protein